MVLDSPFMVHDGSFKRSAKAPFWAFVLKVALFASVNLLKTSGLRIIIISSEEIWMLWGA